MECNLKNKNKNWSIDSKSKFCFYIYKGEIYGENIFISHSSYDKEVVKIFSDLIKKVSLSQIHIWFSNDTDTEGGFLVGDN